MALRLDVSGIEAGYGAVRALHGVSITIEQGETVALLGTNGNGKSTLMKCVMGVVRPARGKVTLEIDGTTHDLARMATEQIVSLGIAMVPEGRRLFPRLSVEENLLLGAFRSQARSQIEKSLASCYEMFPVLDERRRHANKCSQRCQKCPDQGAVVRPASERSHRAAQCRDPGKQPQADDQPAAGAPCGKQKA